jgi:hypothetical protein
MKQFLSGILLACLACSAFAAVDDYDTELADIEGDARLFFVNFTSSLIQVNATILAYGLLALAVAGAGAVALYYLYLESQNAGTGYGSYGSNQYNYNYARSNNDGYEFNSMNILQWISMLQEVYEKFDYNDLECQKRLICEVMKEPEYFGTAAEKFKNGFQYAKYLEVLSLPDDMRELLDEYLDANARADQNKECEEYFQCPYSIRDSIKRNLSGNNL